MPSPNDPPSPPAAELTPETLAKLKKLFVDARALLPFLRSLSDKQRQSLYKMGRKRLAFVEQATADAQGAPELVPGRMDVSTWEAKFDLARTLAEEVRDTARSFADDVESTVMADGSEAAKAALDFKRLLESAAKGDPATYEDRAKRLARLLTEADQAAKAEGRTPPTDPATLRSEVDGAARPRRRERNHCLGGAFFCLRAAPRRPGAARSCP